MRSNYDAHEALKVTAKRFGGPANSRIKRAAARKSQVERAVSLLAIACILGTVLIHSMIGVTT